MQDYKVRMKYAGGPHENFIMRADSPDDIIDALRREHTNTLKAVEVEDDMGNVTSWEYDPRP